MGAKASKGKYVVKEDYTAPPVDGQEENQDRFSIKKGDIVERFKMPPKTSMTEDVAYYVKNPNTKRKDFAPVCILGKKDTLDENCWYFGKLGRAKALHFLRMEYNQDGSYLIRQSDHDPASFALSVKTYNAEKDQFDMKHFKISHNQGQFSLHEKRPTNGGQKFSSLKEFVEAAQEGRVSRLKASGVNLLQVVQRPKPSLISIDEEKDNVDRWKIDKADIETGDKLSSGNFGVVYKGKWRGTRDVAIKTLIMKNNSNSDKLLDEFHKEELILTQLHHPYLVQVFGFVYDGEPMMVMELLSGGDLRSYLHKHGKALDMDAVLNICENIASAMKKLETSRIVHRDLAARNVMLDENNTAKVGDFGLARQGDIYENDAAKFPYQWTAPEAAVNRRFNHKSDVWSFGIVLWEIFSLGETPYKDFTPVDTICPALLADYRLPMAKKLITDAENPRKNEENYSKVYNVMLTCWLKDQEKRPTFDHLWDVFRNFEDNNDYNYPNADFMAEQGFVTEYRGGDYSGGRRKKKKKRRTDDDEKKADDEKRKKKKKKRSKE